MKKVLIIAANYYKKNTESLLLDSKDLLKKANIKYKYIYVPGIFEIPVVIAKYIKKYDGFVALGVVIKGQTPHFTFICKSTFNAIMNLSIKYKKPIGNGIITALNSKQATVRSGSKNKILNGKYKNKGKGGEAAKAVITVLKNVPK